MLPVDRALTTVVVLFDTACGGDPELIQSGAHAGLVCTNLSVSSPGAALRASAGR